MYHENTDRISANALLLFKDDVNQFRACGPKYARQTDVFNIIVTTATPRFQGCLATLTSSISGYDHEHKVLALGTYEGGDTFQQNVSAALTDLLRVTAGMLAKQGI